MKKLVSAILLTGFLAFVGPGIAQGNYDGGYISEPVQTAVSEGPVASAATALSVALADAGAHTPTLLWAAVGFSAVTLGIGKVAAARRRTAAEA